MKGTWKCLPYVRTFLLLFFSGLLTLCIQAFKIRHKTNTLGNIWIQPTKANCAVYSFLLFSVKIKRWGKTYWVQNERLVDCQVAVSSAPGASWNSDFELLITWVCLPLLYKLYMFSLPVSLTNSLACTSWGIVPAYHSCCSLRCRTSRRSSIWYIGTCFMERENKCKLLYQCWGQHFHAIWVKSADLAIGERVGMQV